MVHITQANAHDLPSVRALFGEYLQWATSIANNPSKVRVDSAAMLERDMTDLQKFMPPNGRLLLAADTAGVLGCACMRTLRPGVAELKRMYVYPDQRGRGIGRALLQALIADLQSAGYTTLRLDSGRFMTAAHALYRALGFQESAPYPESEVPEDLRQHCLFMELPL